jgi:hypothetical protein
MRSSCLPILAACAILTARSAPADAETSDAPPDEVAKTSAAPHSVAIAVSSPVSWFNKSFAASAYVAIDRHNVLRGNVAFHDEGGGVSRFVADLTDDYSLSGKIRDVGAAWVWYQEQAWDGPSLELGVLVRERKLFYWDEFDDLVETESRTYAARGQVGWSWLLGGRVFLSVGVGISAGRELGVETSTTEGGPRMPVQTTQKLDRLQIDGEGYLRFGFAFGG